MFSAQRTNPTIKPLTTMNHRSVRNKEFKFGVTQLVVLVGFVLGCVSIAFVLGHHIGWEGGYQSSLASNVSNMVRFPVPAEQLEKEVKENVTSEIYAKLQDAAPSAGVVEAESEELSPIPELETVKTTEAAPVTGLLDNADKGRAVDGNKSSNVLSAGASDPKSAGKGVDAALSADAVFKKEVAKAAQSGATIRVIGEAAPSSADPKSNSSDSATLGTLIKGVEEKRKVVEVPKSAPPPPPAVEPKKAEAVSAVPAAVTATSALGRGWYAQVAAPKSIKDAESLSAKLRSSGFRVTIERAQVKGQDYFRVLVGPEESKQLGDRLITELRREPYIKSEPFMRTVK